MKGKRITFANFKESLNKFLSENGRFLFGFYKGKEGVRHMIFKEHVNGLSLFNPFFSVNGSLYLRRIFSNNVSILVLLRPCEIRSYVELTKLTQIKKSSIISASIDCFGTLSSKQEYFDCPEDPIQLKTYLESRMEDLRFACRMCRGKKGIFGDFGIRFDKSGNMWVIPYTERGDFILNMIEGEEETIPQDMLLDGSYDFERFRSNMDQFQKDFEKCIMCLNCRDMCPVCYCVDCLFNGDEYLPRGDALLNKVTRIGSALLPGNKEIFHFIRMYHVSQTCVGCGSCEEACPQGIPLTRYFKGISERLQEIFSYMSGRSFDEPIPYVTFEEDELQNADD